MLKFVKTKGVTLFSFFFGRKKYFIKIILGIKVPKLVKMLIIG